MRLYFAFFACLATALTLNAQGSFVNWENPHVYPLDRTPTGDRLLAVNTADNRLEVFDISGGTAIHQQSIPVGLDPVSVRARTDTEVWVVNIISDSLSIVDLEDGNVVRTLHTDDEPADVVFSGSRAFVSCSQANTVLVFDVNDLDAAPTRIEIDAEDPRAMAVNAAGTRVYVAVFESGNHSTVLGGGLAMGADAFPPNVVSHPDGPYGGVNPPPNDGSGFSPALNADNPRAPAVGLIVKNTGNQWLDDNGSDWTDFVTGARANLSGRPTSWHLDDHDVAVIDTGDLGVSYVTGLMNICMGLAVNPRNNELTVVGTDAINEVRFEPVLSGRFIRVNLARIAPDAVTASEVVDLNAHLDYSTSTVPQVERDKSLGDPRGVVWHANIDRGYVSGMGSNNLTVIQADGQRSGQASTIEVGEGPTGLALDEGRERLYVLNKFSGSISVVDTVTELEIAELSFFDPTPTAIKSGRKHLYDTHKNSGLGQIACASCHVDSRMDRLAWDLGDPGGEMKSFNQNCLTAIVGGCEDWHPMKGPMTTQTLQDIIGHEPLHWRADRDGIEEFNGAFIGLQGDDVNLSPQEMQEFEDFLASIHFPPNPFRNPDNTLPTDLPLPGHFTTGRFGTAGQPLPNGNAEIGLDLYRTDALDAPFDCVSCHTLPTGLGTHLEIGSLLPPRFDPIDPGPNGEEHLGVVSVDGSTNISIKVPQLLNLYEKVGFEATQLSNRAGFGFLHDGSVDSIARFVAEPVFGLDSDQEVADLVAFMLAFAGSDLPEGNANDLLEPPGPPARDTHAAVGQQLTVNEQNRTSQDTLDRLNAMLGLADASVVGVVARGVRDGLSRGYSYVGSSLFQSDRLSEQQTAEALRLGALPGSEMTFTVVPSGSDTRIGVDRDEDGFFDRDELDVCSDPADPDLTPVTASCALVFSRGDCNADGFFDVSDPVLLLVTIFLGTTTPGCDDACDLNDDGALNIADPGYALSFLFKRGATPAAPFGGCGGDGTPEDGLGCAAFAACP